MKANFRKILAIVFVILHTALLCSCARVVTSNADELTMHTWQSELDNGNIITLTFSGDNATLTLSYKDTEPVQVSGLCELDDTTFVIHDSSLFYSYEFQYVLHYDCVDIIYADTTVSLDKIS